MTSLALLIALLPLLPSRFSGTTRDAAAAPTTQPIEKSAPTTQPTLGKHSSETQSVHRGTLTVPIDGQGYLEPIDPLEVRIRPKVYVGELTITDIA